jgi:hypothetical protein
MIRALPLTAAVLLAAGCATAPAPNSATPAVPGTRCDADRAAGAIGKPAATASGPARRAAGAASVRRYVTGSPLTMDFRADRLNVETDARGIIVKLSCG